MAQNHNVYIGWYAEFERSKRIVHHGIFKEYFCSKEKKHPVKHRECCLCNGKVQTKEEERTSRYPLSCNILGQASQEALDYLTGGLVTMNDLKELDGSIAIFPELVKADKEVVFSPGVKSYPNVSKIQGFIEEIDIEKKPDQQWINKIKKVFDTDNVIIKYGIVMEVI